MFAASQRPISKRTPNRMIKLHTNVMNWKNCIAKTVMHNTRNEAISL